MSVNLKPLASIALSDDWKTLLVEEFAFDYMLNLKQKLIEERKNYQIFPPDHQIFNALSHTSVSQIKIVILGQDPYHGIGQANGLSFSVNKGNNIPPSLKNIFKELNRDVGCSIPNHGDLTSWAKQGVLLLNTSLTVRQAEPASHAKIGWEIFTNRLIEIINLQKENLVFLLWGNHAQSKDQLIDGTKHLVLKAAHPSPFSAHQGFFGCKHFSLANQYLIQKGLGPIEWQITD